MHHKLSLDRDDDASVNLWSQRLVNSKHDGSSISRAFGVTGKWKSQAK